jgi:hypothetical protein
MKINKLALFCGIFFTVLIFCLCYKILTTPPPPSTVQVIRVPDKQVVVESEFRPPPYRNYKPPTFQQVGLLSNSTEILPLYGRATPNYRDQWNYYTSTPGEQIYSLPITYNNRDCTEDIGCNEFYGSESVSVFGKTGTYDTKMYRIN